jgi:ribosome-binding protein aMBF1 (putative translation factor)
MSNIKSNITTLNQFKEKHYGEVNSPKRIQLEQGYESFKIGALIQDARLAKGMTQDQLAIKVGTTKSYISKLENNIKEVRLSTLKKIIEIGFGGSLELSIKI